MSAKICTKCKESKPLEGFFIDRSKADGLYSSCRKCAGMSNASYRARNKGNINRRMKEYNKIRYKSDPEKIIARVKVYYAIKCGKINKPLHCNNCHLVKKLQAHHHDYSKPLYVEWVCSGCHGLKHSGGLQYVSD